MQFWQTTIRTFAVITLVALSACGGSGSSSDAEQPAVTDPTPDFTPDADQSLDGLVINTFKDNGVDITMTGEDGDAFLEFGTLEKDADSAKAFTLKNGTTETLTFSFQMYSISTGFSILDADQQAFGTWNEIALVPGESRVFYLKFNAYYFGTQTSYLTVTAKEKSGFIYFPFRAAVQGAADVRVISSAYMCSDTEAPQITNLDFLKVASGNTFTKSFKICNSGGEDIVLNSINIENASNEVLSDVFDEENALAQYFDWVSDDAISSEFATGFTPAQLASFTAPTMITYTGSIDNPAGSYGISDHNSGALSNRTIAAGSYLLMDVAFKPELAIEADEGSLYEPVAFNALLNLDTSLGVMEVNLLGATSGEEPVLAMTYRPFSYTDIDGVKTIAYDDLTPQPIDLSSDAPAVLFGAAKVFKDGWVYEDERRVEVTIKNAGTGSKALRVFAQNPTGFFGFGDEDANLSVPFSPNDDGTGLAPGEEKTIVLVYHPTPEGTPDEGEKYWDFGQLYLQHTGGNGPYAKTVLVGEQEAGQAVEFYKGGTLIADGDKKSFCAMATAASEAGVVTSQTFTVVNNSPENTLSFTYVVDGSASETPFTATPSASTAAMTVAPGASSSFTINFVAATEGNVSGTVKIVSNFPESTHPELPFNYTLNFTASGLDSGECEFDSGVNDAPADANGKTTVTFVADRITMIMTKLAEPTRNLPPFKFQLPFEIDKEAGTVRLAKDVPFKAVYETPEENDATKFMRSYAHQATGMTGCAPLPSNPYKLEYEAGSWTGDGYTCAVQDLDGPAANLNGDYGKIHMIPSATCMDNNAGEYYTNDDGTKSIIFYHDFAKMDTGSCEVKIFGRVANFAYNPDKGESISSIFKLSEEKPNESEAYYEELYGAYRYNSYITFNANTTCGNKTYTAGTTITADQDPQAIKDCYLALASDGDNNRTGGMLDECSYFNFNVEAGVDNPDCLSDPDTCIAYGPYEPAINPETGAEIPTQYDLTLYNIKMQVFVLNLGDKQSFFSHPGHLLYSDLYVTFTTKRVGSAVEAMNSGDSSWQDLIAVNTRGDFAKDIVFLENERPYKIKDFWDDEKINSEFSNKYETLDGSEQAGIDKGVFRWVDKNTGEISLTKTSTVSHAGWPINFDDRNLGVIVGLGSFHGKGNTAPIFTKEDSSGIGNPLYFALHGCLYNGEDHVDVLAGQGCQSPQLDATNGDSLLLIPQYTTYDANEDGILIDEHNNDENDSTHVGEAVLDAASSAGILPNGYIGDGNSEPIGDNGSPIQCSDLSSIDPIVYIDGDDDEGETVPDDWDIYYRYMACVNFTIFPTDRNRYTNYYSGSNLFFDKDYYSNTACGYGM